MGNPFRWDSIEGQHDISVKQGGRNPGFGAPQRRSAPAPSPEPRTEGTRGEAVDNAAGVIFLLIMLGLLFGS